MVTIGSSPPVSVTSEPITALVVWMSEAGRLTIVGATAVVVKEAVSGAQLSPEALVARARK